LPGKGIRDNLPELFYSSHKSLLHFSHFNSLEAFEVLNTAIQVPSMLSMEFRVFTKLLTMHYTAVYAFSPAGNAKHAAGDL